MDTTCELCKRLRPAESGNWFESPERNMPIRHAALASDLFICGDCSEAIVEAHFNRTGQVAMGILPGEGSQLERLDRGESGEKA